MVFADCFLFLLSLPIVIDFGTIEGFFFWSHPSFILKRQKEMGLLAKVEVHLDKCKVTHFTQNM